VSPARKPAARKPADPAAAEVTEHVLRPPGLPADSQETEPYAYTDPDYGHIGLGGTGDHSAIPECPVCYAYGGGGHGGGCPNAGKDLADWVTEPPAGWSRPERRA
jgi:hypothetical protein